MSRSPKACAVGLVPKVFVVVVVVPPLGMFSKVDQLSQTSKPVTDTHAPTVPTLKVKEPSDETPVLMVVLAQPFWVPCIAN